MGQHLGVESEQKGQGNSFADVGIETVEQFEAEVEEGPRAKERLRRCRLVVL